MSTQNSGILYGKAGAPLDIALSLVEFFMVAKNETLSSAKVALIKVITYLVLTGFIYLFSIISQYLRLKYVVYDDYLAGVFVASSLLFVFGYGHFERLKPMPESLQKNNFPDS